MRRPNRRAAKPQVIEIGGRPVKVRSALEARVLQDLQSRGVSFNYEATKLPYWVERTYMPDVDLDLLSKVCHLEIKGWFKPEDRSKLLAVRRAHPEIDIRLIFANAYAPIRRGSRTTYADWCEKHGFPWATKGKVPEKWML